MDLAELHRIAAEAMRARGFLATFSPDVMREARALDDAGQRRDAGIRDLRGLLWFSIDNDDTRDLDKLSFA